MIEVENLSKKYGDVYAVRDISFTARPGQVTGFLGPNGAGKTTTMRMLTGFMPPSEGRARVSGFDVFDNSMDVRRHVGYLPENVPLYRDLSARAYLMYVAEIRGVRNRRQRADEVLDRVGLSRRAESRIRTLSKGMKQRVGLASALIHNPDVLILDEPTIGLDPIQVLELRDLVRELGRDHTLLFSTHILSEAEQVCDNVIIINQGEIVGSGAPRDLRSQLEQGGRVLLRADAPPARVLPVVQALSVVGHAEVGSDGMILTPSAPDVDPRPEVARAVIAQGWSLLELRPLAVNLEDIFLELTRRNDRSPVSQEETDAAGAAANAAASAVDAVEPTDSDAGVSQ